MSRRCLATIAAVCLLTPMPARAGGTRTFELSSFEDFDRGETEGAAIESSGKVTVGFVAERAELKAMAAFGCIADDKTAVVATADKATLLRVTPSTKAKPRTTKTPKPKKKGAAADAEHETAEASFRVEPIAELEGVLVSAMTKLPGGDLVVATLPGGKLHRVSPRGKVTPFAELKVDQIWALTVHHGRLLVATGPRGELWSTTLEGKDAKVALDVDEKDLLSVLVIGEHVLVGTSPEAKLYQVSDAVAGILVHEFSGNNEVRALALGEHGLLAAVNRFSERSLGSLEALTKTLNRSSLVGQPPTGQLGEDPLPNADATLYHVDLGRDRDVARAAEAPWERWLERKKQYFTDLLAENGDVLVASSSGGKIYRVRGARQAATVADLEERQATGLCRVGTRGPVFATAAHGGAVYQLQAAPASQALYRSEILDAEQPSSYGAVVLRGRGDLRVRARGGPTDEPDARWSAWKDIGLTNGGEGLRGSLAGLPHRRHVQLEVELGSTNAELRALELFYAPENLAPLLTAVDVDRAKFDASDDDEPSANVTIKWNVDARDDDELVYDVRIRPEGSDESQWVKVNGSAGPVTKRELNLDLTTVPDGVYEVEVRASDEPSNGSGNALTDELVSAPFVVDRQRPVLDAPKIDRGRVTVAVNDVGGYVHDAAFSLDGGPFRAASAGDGLFDSPSELVVLELPDDLTAGRHRLVVRARDSFGNMGSVATVVEK